MVGISFKKKLLNVVHLESYTSYKEYKETHKIRVPLDSFICYCIQKFCNSNFVSIRFIPIRTAPENEKASVTLVEEEGDPFVFLINEYEIPWTVALCAYPVVMADDVIITGLCAVTRQICYYRNTYALRQEHDDGLLGFRHTCLQAPNEVSVWTKFCEVEIIRTVQELLTSVDIKEVPDALVRFEDHMRQPVRIHNVYKVAQNIRKVNLKTEKKAKAEQQSSNDEQQATNVKQQSANVEQQAANVEQQVANVEQEVANVVQQEANVEEQGASVKQQAVIDPHANAEDPSKAGKEINAEKQPTAEQQANASQQTNNVRPQKNANSEQLPIADKKDPGPTGEDSSGTKRSSKTRKSKSHKNKAIIIEHNLKDDKFIVNYELSESTYITLEELKRLQLYPVVIESVEELLVKSLLQQANIDKEKASYFEQRAANVVEQVANVEEQGANVKKQAIINPQANTEDQSKAGKEINAEKQTTASQQENASLQTNNVRQQAKPEQVEQNTNSEQLPTADKKDLGASGEGSSDTKRSSKTRKGKSHKTKVFLIDCPSKMEELQVSQNITEGPYLTLADMELLPTYHAKIESIREKRFKSILPTQNISKESLNAEKEAKAEQQAANDEQEVSNVEQKAANVEQEVANVVQYKSNIEEQGASVKQQAIIDPHANAEDQSKTGKEINAEKQTTAEQQANASQQTNNVTPQAKTEHVEQNANSEQLPIADQKDPGASAAGSSDTKRTSKSRKWKSHKKKDLVIECTTKVEDLEVNHDFAEGPYLTLADLVLLPSYHVIIQSIGETRFESLLPFTYKWYKNLITIPRIKETFMSLMSQFNLKQLTFENLTMPTPDDVSLYKCDPKRHNPKKRIYTKEEDIEKALSSITDGMELTVSDNDLQLSFRWKDIPEHANPFSGYLPDTRVQRKSEQLENLALAVLSMATDGDVIVDFCCGTGHLGILLAYLLPRCTIILLENKVESLFRARDRVKMMRLTNVYYYQCNLDFFVGEFDIGIGLHACGIATDLILDKCLKQNARFVLSPCCYGSIHGTCRMKYPRSKKFSSVPFDEYLCIAHAADQTHKEHPLAVRGARCMTVVDSDRARLAEELGYEVTLMKLKPVTCTPKNNLLIGISTKK